MIRKMFYAALTAGLLAACTNEDCLNPASQENSDITINATMQGFLPSLRTKTIVDPNDYSCIWKAGDEIGMFSNRIDGETQTPSQLGFRLTGGEGTGMAEFTGANGWRMYTNGQYNYVAYYPYEVNNTRESIVLDYTGQTQMENNSTANLGDYDFMYSTVLNPAAGEPATFSFSHINALVNLNLAIPQNCQDKMFGGMRISANEDIFTETAEYDIQSLVDTGRPEISVINSTNSLELSFGEEGFCSENGCLNAWLMLSPVDLRGVELTIELFDTYTYFPVLEGRIVLDDFLESGKEYSYSLDVEKSEYALPDKPQDGETLNILVFSNSFGQNCFKYLPNITAAAGITNFHYCRFSIGGSTVGQHLEKWNSDEAYSCSDNIQGSGNRTSKSVVESTPWDIVVFSTLSSTCGNYEKFRDDLRSFSQAVIDACEAQHHKTPLVAWHLIWSYHNQSYNTQIQNYQSIVNATQEMLADNHNVKIVVAPGTAMQNARGTSLNTSISQSFTSDGQHASSGIGCYLGACTWFQTLIAPIYGASIMGNTYRPTDYSFDGDQVTDENVAILQRCAVEAARHPFEVTAIEE